ncbi:hypothetical protein X275_07455 [Marinitoga sp. 1197]|nr:hypothetical protein X275_07455 [Marinitoga sp. 1197]KLO24852.1 hypothetical protein X274_01785 [Marinitoga sp. 1155]
MFVINYSALNLINTLNNQPEPKVWPLRHLKLGV